MPKDQNVNIQGKGDENGGHSPMKKKENALFYMYMQTEIRE